MNAMNNISYCLEVTAPNLTLVVTRIQGIQINTYVVQRYDIRTNTDFVLRNTRSFKYCYFRLEAQKLGRNMVITVILSMNYNFCCLRVRC